MPLNGLADRLVGLLEVGVNVGAAVGALDVLVKVEAIVGTLDEGVNVGANVGSLAGTELLGSCEEDVLVGEAIEEARGASVGASVGAHAV